MKRVLLFLAAILIAGLPAWANVCTCPNGVTCTIAADAGWTGAASCTSGGNGPDQPTDAIEIAAGGTVNWDVTGTRTYDYLWIHCGGGLNGKLEVTAATTPTAPVVMQFDGPTLTLPGIAGSDVWIAVGEPANGHLGQNCGIFTSNNKDLIISWVGAGTKYGILGSHFNGGSEDWTTLGHSAVTLRGAERANTAVAFYSQGATAPSPDTNMVDCMDGVTPPVTGAAGDTIVFTTGKSQEFWYEVTCYPDQCTGAGGCCSAADATTECSATACNGGPCDYQITRNSTGATPGSVAGSSSWSSMVLAVQNAPFGAGGTAIQPTPVDSDANGVANGEGTLPTVGDKFAVFRPVLIQGGTNPITNGATFFTGSGGFDWKYVEFNKMSGQTEEDCDSNLNDGLPPLFEGGSKVLNVEGAAEFINAHNFASRQSWWEHSFTDTPDDVKPNIPRKYRHLYLHDQDSTVSTVCGPGGTSPEPDDSSFAPVLVNGIDGDFRKIDGLTFEGVHIARWGAGAAFFGSSNLAMGSRYRGVTVRDLIIQDYPGINGYGTGCEGMNIGVGVGTVFDGVSAWNLGQNSRGCHVFFNGGGGLVVDVGTGVTSVVGVRIDNLFVVNVDSNTTASGGGGPSIGGVFIPGGPVFDETTRGMVLSNSYAKGIVGAFSWGGITRFNFIKDVVWDDDVAANCTAINTRGAIHLPVEATGNVITRSNSAESCMEWAWVVDLAGTSPYTDVTRKITSNLAFNMDSTSTVFVGGLATSDPGTPNPTRNIDFYNNIVDLRDNLGGASNIQLGVANLNNNFDGTVNAFYNIFMNLSGSSATAIFKSGIALVNENFNRFFRVNVAVEGGNAAQDVDSDLADIFAHPSTNFYYQKCESPDKLRGSGGTPIGALRFGITSFNHFHPAVIPLMDADVFKLRYNWLSCGAAYQDAIPR